MQRNVFHLPNYRKHDGAREETPRCLSLAEIDHNLHMPKRSSTATYAASSKVSKIDANHGSGISENDPVISDNLLREMGRGYALEAADFEASRYARTPATDSDGDDDSTSGEMDGSAADEMAGVDFASDDDESAPGEPLPDDGVNDEADSNAVAAAAAARNNDSEDDLEPALRTQVYRLAPAPRRAPRS